MPEAAGSEFDQLFYPALFAGGHVDLSSVLRQVTASTIQKCTETIALRQAICQRERHHLVDAAIVMAQSFACGGTLLALGNGGSSTDAQDMVEDLMAPPFAGWRALPALALTHDVAAVTAIANDVGFGNVFVRQVIAFGRAGDMALGISTSGNSENVLQGLIQAKKQGLMTFAISGYDGGKMLHIAEIDHCFTAENEHTPRIQEGQATIYHTLIALVQAILAEMPGTGGL